MRIIMPFIPVQKNRLNPPWINAPPPSGLSLKQYLAEQADETADWSNRQLSYHVCHFDYSAAGGDFLTCRETLQNREDLLVQNQKLLDRAVRKITQLQSRVDAGVAEGAKS